MVHHYISLHGVQEQDLRLHADNCVGQNKNNTFIHYLLWRVMTKKCKKASLSFMLAGHTKFAPDRFFGLFKRRYRHSQVNTLVDVALAVETSTTTGQNKVQLTVDERGTRQVKYFDWSAFFGTVFRNLPNMTTYHHFRSTSSVPGVIFAKEFADTEEKQFKLLKDGCDLSGQSEPTEIHPPGLDPARQWYLYEQIRPFCGSNLARDLTCPKPLVPRPGSDSTSARKRTQALSELPETPKRKRLCSHCRSQTHLKTKNGKIVCPVLLSEQQL